VTKDVAYGPARLQTLDVYAPDTPAGGKRPVMIYVHGGGWGTGWKSQVSEKPAAFNKAGYIFMSMDYPLVPEGTVEQQAASVAQAVRWVKDNAARLGADPARISIMGHSAGGHLVALVGTDESYLKAQGLGFEDVHMVLPLDAGTLDVPQHMSRIMAGDNNFGAGMLVERRLKKMFGNAFGTDQARWERLSPVHHLNAGPHYPPFLVLTVASRMDSTAQGKAFTNKLHALGGMTEFHPIADRNHGTINRQFGESDDEAFRDTLDFLSRLQ
jgi:arylformamidase